MKHQDTRSEPAFIRNNPKQTPLICLCVKNKWSISGPRFVCSDESRNQSVPFAVYCITSTLSWCVEGHRLLCAHMGNPGFCWNTVI